MLPVRWAWSSILGSVFVKVALTSEMSFWDILPLKRSFTLKAVMFPHHQAELLLQGELSEFEYGKNNRYC